MFIATTKRQRLLVWLVYRGSIRTIRKQYDCVLERRNWRKCRQFEQKPSSALCAGVASGGMFSSSEQPLLYRSSIFRTNYYLLKSLYSWLGKRVFRFFQRGSIGFWS